MKAAAAPAIMAALALSACMRGLVLPTPVFSTSAKQLRISGARAYPDRRGVLIEGQVWRPALASYPLWGHLHVVASLGGGRPPLVVDTKWRWSSRPPRSSWFGSFSALLRTPEPARIENVRIEYRPAPDDRQVKTERDDQERSA